MVVDRCLCDGGTGGLGVCGGVGCDRVGSCRVARGLVLWSRAGGPWRGRGGGLVEVGSV